MPGHLSSGQFNLVKTFLIGSFFATEDGICERQRDPCPEAGFSDHGDFCWKHTTDFDWGHWSTWYCERSHGRGECEQCGLLIYKKCPAGYKRYGCNYCKKACPGGWADWGGLSCRKPKDDCAGVSGLETTCGDLWCAKDDDTCANKGVSIGIDMLIAFASIWDMTGTSKAAVAASREAANQAAQAATKEALKKTAAGKVAAKALAMSAAETIAWNIAVKLASDHHFSDASEPCPPRGGGGGRVCGGQGVLNAAALAAGTAIALEMLIEEGNPSFMDVAKLIDPTGIATVVAGFTEKACPGLKPMKCEPSPLWHEGDWTEWTSECGSAERTRAVTCLNGCDGTALPNSRCEAHGGFIQFGDYWHFVNNLPVYVPSNLVELNGQFGNYAGAGRPKPHTEETRVVAAYAPKWIYGEWQLQDSCRVAAAGPRCAGACGHTKRTRHAECHATCGAECTDELPTEENFDAALCVFRVSGSG